MVDDLIKRLRSMIEPDDAALRESLKVNGWLVQLPSIADEHGVTLVGNRRTAFAKELGIAPVIQTVEFGSGSDADVARLKLATVSNIGGVPMTPKDRKRIAEHLYDRKGEHKWTEQAIADGLGVSQQTIARDLADFNLLTMSKSKHEKTKTNPRGSGRPKGSGGTRKNSKQRPAGQQSEFDRARELIRKRKAAGQPVTRTILRDLSGISNGILDSAMQAERSYEEGQKDAKAGTNKQTAPPLESKPEPTEKSPMTPLPGASVTGMPMPGDPGFSLEKLQEFHADYGRTPLHPKVHKDSNRADWLCRALENLCSEDMPDGRLFVQAIDVMLAHVPDTSKVDKNDRYAVALKRIMEKDHAADARKIMTSVRKNLPRVLAMLHDLETKLQNRKADGTLRLAIVS